MYQSKNIAQYRIPFKDTETNFIQGEDYCKNEEIINI